MTAGRLEDRYRIFLLVVSAIILVGTAAELWFTEHLESAVQVVPFVLCGLGLLSVLVVLIRTGPETLLSLRAVSVLLAAGGVYGIYEHVAHNFAFELEIRPTASAGDVVTDALHGASPILAPGILALAAVIAAAATYRHPALRR